MHNYASLFWTTVGRKLFTALFGLGLVVFVILHLAGNLTIFMGPLAINEYAHFLETALHGLLLPLGEVALIGLFGVHIVSALLVQGQNRSARSQGYVKQRDAGGASRKTLSSTSMLVTGLILLAFVLIHVAQFRLGILAQLHTYPNPDGHDVRNLYRMLAETFHEPLWVGFYCFTMVLLALHMRHGIWSAFQTLGALSPGLRRFLIVGGAVLAVLLAAGFFIMPLYVFFYVDPTSPDVINPGGLRP